MPRRRWSGVDDQGGDRTGVLSRWPGRSRSGRRCRDRGRARAGGRAGVRSSGTAQSEQAGLVDRSRVRPDGGRTLDESDHLLLRGRGRIEGDGEGGRASGSAIRHNVAVGNGRPSGVSGGRRIPRHSVGGPAHLMLAAMRDEQYAAEDLPSYGAHEQPAIVSRTRRHLRTTLLGTIVAVLGLASAVAGLVTYPDIDGVFQGRRLDAGDGLVQRGDAGAVPVAAPVLAAGDRGLARAARQRPGGRGRRLLDPAAGLVRRSR